MIYTKEVLIDYPVSKLIDIILTLQNDNMEVVSLRKKLNKIASVFDEVSSEDSSITGVTRQGRPRLSDEERMAKAAERYERQKAYQRAKYAENKAKKNEQPEEISIFE